MLLHWVKASCQGLPLSLDVHADDGLDERCSHPHPSEPLPLLPTPHPPVSTDIVIYR